MTKLAIPAACMVLLLPLAGARPAPAPEAGKDVKAIIAKAIAARGGAAAIEKYKAATAKFSATYYLNETEVRSTGIAYELAFEQSRVDWTFQIACQEVSSTQVFDGEKGWTSANGTVTDMTKDDVADFREVMYASAVADLHGLTGKDVQLTPLGESKVGDKPVVGVRVSAKGHKDISLYFDKTTGLLLKKELLRKEKRNEAEFKEETLYSDYKNVSGMMFPFHVSSTHDGKPFFIGDWSEISVSEKLPDGILAKP